MQQSKQQWKAAAKNQEANQKSRTTSPPTRRPTNGPTNAPTLDPTGSPTPNDNNIDNEFCQAIALDAENHCGTEKDGEPKIMMCYYDAKKNRNRSKCESPSDIEDKYQDINSKLMLHCGCCIVPTEISEKHQDNKNCPIPSTRGRRQERQLNYLRPRGV